jgi:hypothetical protein
VAVGKVERDFHPFPPFGADAICFAIQLFGNQTIEQRRVLQPSAVVLLKEIPHHLTAGSLVAFDSNELRPFVGAPDGSLRQQASNVIGLLVVRPLQSLPHLLLPFMVRIDRERHELIERHAVLGVDVEQLWRDGGQLKPLLDDLDTDEEDRRDLLLAHALLAQIAEGTELIERMEGCTLDVFGKRVFLSETFGPDDTGNRRGTGKPLLLDQKLKCPPATGRDFEHPGFHAVAVKYRPHGEALQERSSCDVLRELLDRNARLDAANVGLAQHQPIERNVPGLAEGDLLNGLCH